SAPTRSWSPMPMSIALVRFSRRQTLAHSVFPTMSRSQQQTDLTCGTRESMTRDAARRFIERHGVVLEGGRGPVPNLAETVAGESIRGSWWAHAKGHEIFWLTRDVRDWRDVLVCRVVGGKITYVHRRLWPALIRLASEFERDRLASLREVHTPSGRHVLQKVP